MRGSNFGTRLPRACLISVLTLVLGLVFYLHAQDGSDGPDLGQPGTVRSLQVVHPITDLASIRVLSWNTDHGEHLDAVTAGLARNPADLCLCQEVDWGTSRTGGSDVSAMLARRLGLNLSYAVEFEELSQGSQRRAFIGQATLTRLPVLRSRILRFAHQSGFWKLHGWIPSSVPLFQRRVGGRVALVTELQYPDRLLVVYNAHLESRSYGRIQMQQLDEILSDLSDNYKPDTAVILGGDLNTKYFPSLFLHKLQKLGFRSAAGDRIERTHTIAMALDWIFVRGPFRIESGGVGQDWKGSDHFPIRVQLTPSGAKQVGR